MPDPCDSTQAGGVEKPARPTKQRMRRVLLIDPSVDLANALKHCQPEHGKVRVTHSKTIKQAIKKAQAPGKFDLAVISESSSTASAIDLAGQIQAIDTSTAVVLLTNHADFATAQQALQIGAMDLIVRAEGCESDTAWLEDALTRINAALDRQWQERVRSSRVRKLKRLCKKLNAARLEVTDQVDVLCNDLVTAYQELAVQMQNITHANGYEQAIGEELDLEVVLRKTLEYIVKQAGPCNAAVFLPSSADEFALGGYVNYDCTKESADMLLEHLADVLAPRIAETSQGVLHITENQSLSDMLGDDWNYLADCHLLAMPASHDDEALAVITLFRDNNQPFSNQAIEALACISDQMGELLGRIIRVHHRAVPGFNDYTSPSTPSEGFLPPTDWKETNDYDEPEEEEDDGFAF